MLEAGECAVAIRHHLPLSRDLRDRPAGADEEAPIALRRASHGAEEEHGAGAIDGPGGKAGIRLAPGWQRVALAHDFRQRATAIGHQKHTVGACRHSAERRADRHMAARSDTEEIEEPGGDRPATGRRLPLDDNRRERTSASAENTTVAGQGTARVHHEGVEECASIRCDRETPERNQRATATGLRVTLSGDLNQRTGAGAEIAKVVGGSSTGSAQRNANERLSGIVETDHTQSAEDPIAIRRRVAREQEGGRLRVAGRGEQRGDGAREHHSRALQPWTGDCGTSGGGQESEVCGHDRGGGLRPPIEGKFPAAAYGPKVEFFPKDFVARTIPPVRSGSMKTARRRSTPSPPRQRERRAAALPPALPASLEKELLAMHAAIEIKPLCLAIERLLRTAVPPCQMGMAIMGLPWNPAVFYSTRDGFSDPFATERADAAANLLVPSLVARPGRKFSSPHDFFATDEEYMRSPIYREVAKKEGWHYAYSMFFWRGSQFTGYVGLVRAREAGDFDKAEIARIHQLRPQIETALRRVLKVDRLRTAREAVEHFLVRAPLPVVVLDWNLTPVYRNRAGEEFCARWNHGARSGALNADAAFAVPDAALELCRALCAGIEARLRNRPPRTTASRGSLRSAAPPRATRAQDHDPTTGVPRHAPGTAELPAGNARRQRQRSAASQPRGHRGTDPLRARDRAVALRGRDQPRDRPASRPQPQHGEEAPHEYFSKARRDEPRQPCPYPRAMSDVRQDH